VLITDATRKLLPDESFEFEERPSVALKGKQVEVKLWVPRARDHAESESDFDKARDPAPAGSGRD
jgi:class 3 adenylate cyclase